jgi:UDP-N-acetylglucosamine acyltransferase
MRVQVAGDRKRSVMTTKIHPTAIVDPKARLAEGVDIGPYCVIGPDVTIGRGTRLIHHVSVLGVTTIGEGNELHPFAAIGGPPQDLKYEGGQTKVIVGDHNAIREYATIHTGTEMGGGVTTVGSHNLIMAYTHIAHDCHVEDHCILANVTQMAGHTRVESGARVSGMCAIHQFVTIGTLSFVAGFSGVTKDVPPYMIMAGAPRAVVRGLNKEGLRRAGLSDETIAALRSAYVLLFDSDIDRATAHQKIISDPIGQVPEVKRLLAFLEETSNARRSRKLEELRTDRASGIRLDPVTFNVLPDVASGLNHAGQDKDDADESRQ